MKPSSYLELPDAADASEQDSQVPLPEGARRVAVIDLGSNSLRLLVSQVGGDGRIQVLNCVKSMVRLGEGAFENQALQPQAIERTVSVLKTFARTCRSYGVSKVVAVATASVREAENGKEFTERVKAETGIDFSVISGPEEARLITKGVEASLPRADYPRAYMDIGGGSTEVVAFADGKITDAVSLEFGSLSMYKTYVSRLFPKNSEERAIRKKVENEIKKVKFLKKKQFADMVGIGGTIRAVKKFNNDRFGLPKENDRILMDQMHLLLEDLQEEEKLTLNKILRVAPDRVHTMVPGMIILDTLCDYFSCEEIRMSNFGVREGYLYKKVVMGK